MRHMTYHGTNLANCLILLLQKRKLKLKHKTFSIRIVASLEKQHKRSLPTRTPIKYLRDMILFERNIKKLCQNENKC